MLTSLLGDASIPRCWKESHLQTLNRTQKGDISSLRPVIVKMKSWQGLEDDNWLNLERGYDVGPEAEYRLAYYGSFHPDFLSYATDTDMKLYEP